MIEDGFNIKLEKFDQTTKEKPKDDPVGRFLERFGEALDVKHAVSGKIVPSYMSAAQKAESMQAILRNIGAGKKIKQLSEGQLDQEEIKRLRLSIGILDQMYKDPAAREKYLENRKKLLREIKTVNGNTAKFKILRREAGQAQSASDEQARQIFSQRGGRMSEVDLLLFEAGKEQWKEKKKELEEFALANPELGALAQYENLKDYARQLRGKKFIWTPSRLKLLEEIEEAFFSGRPVLLSGESGTGKTRLVEQAALKLTGQIANETPGKDVRFQDLVAKPKISPDGGTFYEYKEIGEAATGMFSTADSKPRHKGRVVADDEFNLLGESEQTERLARISAWTPGKRVKMPVTNQEVMIADNFLYCAMVNLASERYSRRKIPPEVLRKFAKVDVDYPKQTEAEPEIYEMMLAALMDENGRIRIAAVDLSPEYEYREEPKSVEKESGSVSQTVRAREFVAQKEEGGKTRMAGGFLWRLAGALGEINKSFSGSKEAVLKSKGEEQCLKNMIVDIGTVLGWLKEYSTVGRSKDLEEFFCERMQKQFLSREAYGLEDRELVKDFLKYYGIETDKKTNEKPEERENMKKEQRTREFEPMTPLEIGLLSPRVKYEKVIKEEPILTESYRIGSDGKRIEFYIRKYEEGDKILRPDQIFMGGDGKSYQFLGINKKDGSLVCDGPLSARDLEKLGLTKKEKGSSEKVADVLKVKWKNPEDGQEQKIEIDLEKNLHEQKKFYKEKLNLNLDESKVREIWSRNFAEIKAEIERYGYDSILIIPDNLPEEENLNRDLIESMEEDVVENGQTTKKKVASTWQGSNFKSGGSFAGVRNSYPPGYRIVLKHSVQNIEDHPILKRTRSKNVIDVTGLNKTEVERRITHGEKLPVDCEIEINGQPFKIKDQESQSLEEYIVQQAMHFEKTGQHLDSKSSSYAWLLKSFSGSSVAVSDWDPDDRRLSVAAYDPSNSDGRLGLRLSRSFS